MKAMWLIFPYVIPSYKHTKIHVSSFPTVMNKAVLENISEAPETNANFLFLQISYESDLDKAMQIIREEAEKHPHYMDIRNAEEIKMLPICPISSTCTLTLCIQYDTACHHSLSKQGRGIRNAFRFAYIHKEAF